MRHLECNQHSELFSSMYCENVWIGTFSFFITLSQIIQYFQWALYVVCTLVCGIFSIFIYFSLLLLLWAVLLLLVMLLLINCWTNSLVLYVVGTGTIFTTYYVYVCFITIFSRHFYLDFSDDKSWLGKVDNWATMFLFK